MAALLQTLEGWIMIDYCYGPIKAPGRVAAGIVTRCRGLRTRRKSCENRQARQGEESPEEIQYYHVREA
ncbi:MAG: hypothetical protein C7B43_14165 [Sulfobacillus benefaciens]|uniref:Uncharacterized protein n=1 Tax=Sulfobacillus benefaciens TaxID=453960 RepID=A0A2T2WVT9_9FIRM|nr:MAG: hypothetical protein C7B43_14165 [Sulfobacillus benefaciens]